MGTAAAALARTGALRTRPRGAQEELLYPLLSRWFGCRSTRTSLWLEDRWLRAGSSPRPSKPRPFVSTGIRIPHGNTGISPFCGCKRSAELGYNAGPLGVQL